MLQKQTSQVSLPISWLRQRAGTGFASAKVVQDVFNLARKKGRSRIGRTYLAQTSSLMQPLMPITAIVWEMTLLDHAPKP